MYAKLEILSIISRFEIYDNYASRNEEGIHLVLQFSSISIFLSLLDLTNNKILCNVKNPNNNKQQWPYQPRVSLTFINFTKILINVAQKYTRIKTIKTRFHFFSPVH